MSSARSIPQGAKSSSFSGSLCEQAEMSLRRLLPQLFHRRGRSIFLKQVNQHFLVQIGGIYIVQRFGVAGFSSAR